ncbi:hypothetical protein A167_00184 [Alcanivorax sp. S71-1-4]|jgi:hypothetical protein|uniref:hypothetical protein n=1 Tax=Alcanivorax sp. S71-1-4 TaxID=1177159 RepID=UPI00135A8A73|nr:hypothetical protein [Alcanivorax sp. S71-1-4]KAF0811152.1 hypothetical protein A167_00184 [Alcanivorax sp. S71-1-4]
MDSSAYAPPRSDLNKVGVPEVPAAIRKKIRAGWIVAVISGVLTLAIMLFAISTGALSHLFDIWTSVDVVLIFLLAFGIYRRSRVAATLMFLYYTVSKVTLMIELGKPSGLWMSLVFFYFYFQAMIGTFEYHKFLKTAER